jgi:DNA-binding response OmpR family regulator
VILVVEDHPDTQSAVAEHLSQRGFEVLVASDGETAMRLARARRPDLVYLDLCLPHISGYEVCEQIRADQDLRDLVVLMTSARGPVERVAHSLEAGADVYVSKPFDLEELAEHIERSLAAAR